MDHLSVAPEKPAQLHLRPALGPDDQLRVHSDDDLGRWRLTVLFRAFMAVPHVVWLGLWALAMLVLAPVLWIATLVARRPPEGLRELYARFVRYALHVHAFAYLAADPFPDFLGRPRSHPVDLDAPPPGDHGRWGVALRLVLALPPLALVGSLTGAGVAGAATSTGFVGVLFVAAFLGWWASLVRGRMPAGLRDLLVWALGYSAQAYGYLLLVTPRYPNSDPAVAPLAPLPAHPVRLELADELRRDRWMVAFRFVLVAPHFAWLTLWGLAALLAAVGGWLAALALGRLPRPLHRFLAAYVRYWAHVTAFAYLGGGPFPGFTGRAGGYPVDVAIDPPERQRRAGVGFRGLLAVPAMLVAAAVGTIMFVAAVGGWFAALATGRMPRGLRNLVAYGARYSAQTYAYLLLVTPRYPYSGPADFRP